MVSLGHSHHSCRNPEHSSAVKHWRWWPGDVGHAECTIRSSLGSSGKHHCLHRRCIRRIWNTLEFCIGCVSPHSSSAYFEPFICICRAGSSYHARTGFAASSPMGSFLQSPPALLARRYCTYEPGLDVHPLAVCTRIHVPSVTYGMLQGLATLGASGAVSIYVADAGDHTVRLISALGVVTKVAGT